MKIVHGAAPAALVGLARPDAIFIGGGATGAGVVEAAWDALEAGGPVNPRFSLSLRGRQFAEACELGLYKEGVLNGPGALEAPAIGGDVLSQFAFADADWGEGVEDFAGV